jgi:NADPH-dependent 2,4-dienoyl-CoA reductase/sulfur reductase-like enzyme
MPATRVVVVGANAAGMSAAHQALRGAKSRGLELEVVALERSFDVSYSACGIPYWIAGDVDAAEALVARTADEHRKLGVDLRLGTSATRIDVEQKTVAFQTADGRSSSLRYDELVLATGARAVVPDWARDPDGELVPGVHPVKSLQDGRDWIERLGLTTHDRDSPRPETSVIVGGGYIGIEMAETMIRRGLHTTLVTRSRVMSHLDAEMSDRIERHLTTAGVAVLTDSEVTAVQRRSDGSVQAVVTAKGDVLPADVVVAGIGAEPNTSLGSRAGLPIGSYGGYRADPRGQITDRVWAVGDCCETMHRLTGEYTFLPLGTHANKQGRVAGENLSGGDVEFRGVLGTAITRFESATEYVEVSRTGLSTAEAEAAGRRVAGLVTEGTTASGYMPEATPIAIKVLADPDSRQLVGMQIVGGLHAAKRIDTAATALWGSMTVDDLAGMDLSYAPPFATAWEIVQIAARRLAERI